MPWLLMTWSCQELCILAAILLPTVSIGADGYCRRSMRLFAPWKTLRIAAIGMKSGGMMHSIMNKLAI